MTLSHHRMKQLAQCPFAIALLLILTTIGHAQTYGGRIGVSLGGIGGNAREFVDCMKTAKPWQTLAGAAASTDGTGWPTCDAKTIVFDLRPFGAWAPPIDDPAGFHVNTGGTYKLTMSGQATITVGGSGGFVQNQLFDPAANQTTADVVLPAGHGGLLTISLSNTRRTPTAAANSGFTNLRLIQPGYAADTNQVFRDEYVKALKPFAYLRFMDWTQTNGSNGTYPAIRQWTTRKLPSDATQRPFGTKKDGACWEHVIDLANAVGRDAWINVPVDADGASATDTSSYVYQLARLFKEKLRPDLNVYIEYSNEVWNSYFSQYHWNYAAAKAEGAGSNLNNPSTVEATWAIRRHTKRLVEISKIFGSVFGAGSINSRVRVIYAWQIGGWLPWYDHCLTWVNTNYGPPKDYFYGIAGAPYFNESRASSTATVPEILLAMRGSSDGTVSSKRTLRTYATKWGLKLGCYEGGPDNGHFGTTNVGNRILANRDPGMGELVIYDLKNNFLDLSDCKGDFYTYFVDCSAYSRWGSWGLTEDVANTNTPKYNALLKLIGLSAVSNLRATVVSSTRVDLTWTDTSEIETAMYVERKIGATGTWSTIAALPANSTSYIDASVVAGSEYVYRVSTSNNGASSPASNEAVAVASTTLPTWGNGTGLRGELFNNKTLTPPAAAVRTDAKVDFYWTASPGTGIKADNFSVRWTGQVQAPVTGAFTFSTRSDDGVRLWVNNLPLITNWTNHGPTDDHANTILNLTSGQKVDLKLEFYEATGSATAKLYWSYPGQTRTIVPQSQLYPPAILPPVSPVKLTGTAIGTAGSYNNSGNDRSKALDGNLTTYFDAPVASGAWAGLDMGGPKTLVQLKFCPRGGLGSRMVGGKFQASNDPTFASETVTLHTITATPASATLTTVPVSAATTYRYIRYLSPANSYGNVAEIEFWGN